MASIFDSLAYEGSSLPESARRAALNELEYQKALKARLPLAVEGSGIPESVRKAAQGVLERGAKVAPEVVSEAAPAAGRGILSRAGGALFGPVGMGVQAALTPEELGNSELTPEQQQAQARMAVQNMGPQVAGEAVRYGQDVAQRAVDSKFGNKGVSLLSPNPQEEIITKDAEPAVQETPVGPVVESNPTTVPQAAAKAAQEQETQRQQLEAGALNGLSSGAVSRPQMAKAIVEADATRAGKQLTPDQTKLAITQELSAMKTMDNKDLSQYVSYALMAAGVLAAVLDKSGRAGDAFSASFNKQLDRNLAAGLQNQKTKAAAAKLNMENSWKQRQFAQTDTKLEQGQRALDQTGKYQEGQLELGADRVAATREATAASSKLGYDRLSQDASQFETSSDLRRQGLLQRQTNADRNYDLQVEAGERDAQRVTQGATNTAANLIRSKAQADLAKKKLNSEGGVTISSKDAEKIVKEFETNQNINLGDNRGTVAVAVMNAAKNDPEFRTNPSAVITKILTGGGYEQSGSTWRFSGPNTPNIRQKKQ